MPATFSFRIVAIFCLVIGLFPLPARAQSTPGADNSYRIGVARVDITPDYPIRLNGFGFRRAESEGVSQRIWAKALAISQRDESPFVLIAVDSLGVRMTMVDEVASVLNQEFGIPRQNIALTFTHSHCTPKVNGACDYIFGTPIPDEHQRRIDQYTEQLTKNLIHVARQAVNARQTGSLQFGIGNVGFAANRRTPGGPVDHDLPVLVARDANNQIKAIYTSYACHCVTLSFNQISGDWAGYAQTALERQFPGAIALVSIGAGSDANPTSGVTGDDTEAAAAQGNEIAAEIDRLVETDLSAVDGGIQTQLVRLQLPLAESPSRQQLQSLSEQDNYTGFNARQQLQRLDRGQPLMTHLEYPIQSVTFGDRLALVFLAGEVCVDYSLRLKRELDRDRLWINGYSNDFGGYIPSERLLREGGYGGGGEAPIFTWPAPLLAGVEQQVIDAVKTQLDKSFRVTPGTHGVPPKSPEASLETITTHPRFRVELVASEPQIQDPVAIDFGINGQVWVAEMPDYSRRVDEPFAPQGRIRVLRDSDRDGLFETARTFATGFRFPTDVKIWRDGILVCDAPDILFLRDSDGDGSADIRQVLFSGFATHNPHGRVNSLRLGLDNWVYGSGGLFGGTITNFKGAEHPIGTRDFRCQPDSGELEPVTGTTQQGRVRDDWGNWFGCHNSDLLRHYPWDDRYGRRNPFVVPPPTTRSLGENNRLYPPEKLVLFRLSGTPGKTTSACGLEIYRDDWLGDDVKGNTFTCEPANQLIHRLLLQPAGTSFSARRADEEAEREFLTASDRWFRPVQIRTAPDGTIWIVDMYRYVIEHPRWIPDESKVGLNLFAGSDRGRIYRVSLPDQPRRSWISFDRLSAEQLVEELQSPNGTRRDMAHQLLLWKGAVHMAPHLEQLAASADRAETRLQALCVLDGLDALSAESVSQSLRDPHPAVRQHAIRLSEKFPAKLIMDLLSELVVDSHPTVRMQLAYSIGEIDHTRAHWAIAQLMASDADPYVLAAAMSSIGSHNVASVVQQLIRQSEDAGNVAQLYENQAFRQLLQMCGSVGTPDAIHLAMRWVLDQPEQSFGWQCQVIADLLEAIDNRQPALVERMAKDELSGLAALFDRARAVLGNATSDRQMIQPAIQLLGRRAGPTTLTLFEAARIERFNPSRLLAETYQPALAPEMQRELVQAIGRLGHADGADELMRLWPHASPQLRDEIIDALLSRDAWLPQVMNWLATGQLQRSDFQADRRRRLTEHSSEPIRQRALEIFEMSSLAGDPTGSIDKWKAALQLKPELNDGRQLFRQHCIGCHRLEGEGSEVGPDLLALTYPTAEAVLVSIVEPNRDLSQQYVEYLALMNNGQTQSGLLVSETATSITLRQKEGKEFVLKRNEIDEFRATKNSMMPTGLDQELDHQQMADLIAVVIAMGNRAKSFDGNRPHVVTPRADGTIELPAAAAEIYGDQIIFESASPYQNIGYWHSQDDFVVWKFELPSGGAFDVWFDYACHDNTAGNTLAMVGGADPAIIHQVAGTGSWDQYRQIKLGTLRFGAGLTRLTVRPRGALRKPALLDLRTVLLVPAGQPPDWQRD